MLLWVRNLGRAQIGDSSAPRGSEQGHSVGFTSRVVWRVEDSCTHMLGAWRRKLEGRLSQGPLPFQVVLGLFTWSLQQAKLSSYKVAQGAMNKPLFPDTRSGSFQSLKAQCHFHHILLAKTEATQVREKRRRSHFLTGGMSENV